ncbi:hypothetical protein A0O28_0007080 [Trichoderma guizhouense]|uniref:Uncharacterized protein n=1 Tax=Trichoderma guizhouense TaxID=1491466 RepID=A0A1T3CHQ7_9HYPO|nr:hypothetical protein A0O28_0007080 [Trichoderma guizhouense]
MAESKNALIELTDPGKAIAGVLVDSARSKSTLIELRLATSLSTNGDEAITNVLAALLETNQDIYELLRSYFPGTYMVSQESLKQSQTLTQMILQVLQMPMEEAGKAMGILVWTTGDWSGSKARQYYLVHTIQYSQEF